MIDFSKIAYRLRGLKALEIGLIAPRLTLYALPQSPPHMEARIDTRLWDVEIGLFPAFDPEEDDRLRPYMTQRHVDGIEGVLVSLLYHEGFHWLEGLGCPMDIDTHKRILKAVQETLKQDKKAALTPYMTNLFEDLIVNTSLRAHEKPVFGLPVFFYDQLVTAGSKKSRLAEAFVLLNLSLWGEGPEEDLLLPLMKKGPQVVDAVSDILDELGVSTNDAPKNFKLLGPKEDWPRKAAFIARRLARFLKPRMSLPTLGPKGKEERGRKINGRKVPIRGPKPDESRLDGGPSLKDLDALYGALAKKVRIAIPKEGTGLEFPIAWYGLKPFDPQRHMPWRIKPRLIVDPESPFGNGLNVQVPEQALTIPIAQARPSALEADVCLLLDASGSMLKQEDGPVPWGMESPYHFALLGLYGILESLGEKLAALRFQLVAFSERTRASGWVGMENFEAIKKIAFSPEKGGTHLCLRALREPLAGAPKVVLLLSDGGIHNWASINKDFMELVSRHYFGALDLGNREAMKDLKAHGFPVYPVKSGEDLTRLMIVLGTRRGSL